jgi:hypothetical protein
MMSKPRAEYMMRATKLCRGVITSNTDGYHRNHLCFHIFVRIRIRIRIVLDTNTNADVFGCKYG